MYYHIQITQKGDITKFAKETLDIIPQVRYITQAAQTRQSHGHVLMNVCSCLSGIRHAKVAPQGDLSSKSKTTAMRFLVAFFAT